MCLDVVTYGGIVHSKENIQHIEDWDSMRNK